MWPFSKKKTKKEPKNQVLTKEERSKKIREEAMANMRKAREEIGEETLNKIAAAIEQMEKNKKMEVVEKTKRQIDKMDKKEVASHIRGMMNE